MTHIRKEMLSALREQLPDQTVQNWFESAHWDLNQDPGNGLTLTVSSAFHRSQIQSRYHSTFRKVCKQVIGENVDVRVRVDRDLEERSGRKDRGEKHRSSAAEQDAESNDADHVRTDVHSDTKGPGQAARIEDTAANPGTGETSHDDSQPVRAANSIQPTGSDTSSGNTPTERGPNVNAVSSDRASSSASVSGQHSEERVSTRPARRQLNANEPRETGPKEFHRTQVRHSLKDRYAFSTFVEGDSNALARNAAAAVAASPGETKFNPLLVYGGVGLGKTHLAQAIANYVAAEKNAEYICYESSETFTTQFVQAIRDGNGDKFSRRYRSVDVLILDDVQFFEGKEKTQEQFFHLFNALHQRQKQIVLCADRPPSDIDGIEDRLLSRFDWGLSADIQQPTFETRLAILQRKAKSLELDVENDVLELMAHSITDNVRDLEGALKQISARASLIGDEIDVSVARRLLKNQIDLSGPGTPDAEEIIEVVASYYGVSHKALVGRSRKKEVVRPRHVAMYLCRKLTDLSFSSIGVRFAGRDHSTVSHACNKIRDLLDVESELNRELEEVQRRIQGARVRSLRDE